MKYSIEISGSGGCYGIGGISNEQFLFWKDPKNNKQLSAALKHELKNTDGIPQSVRFADTYTSYTNVGQCYGTELDYTNIRITGENGFVVFNDDYFAFKDMYESEYEYKEISLPEDGDESSHFLFWARNESDTFFTATFETDFFEPEYLSFIETDIYGETVLLTGIAYENTELKLTVANPVIEEEEFILL